MKHIEVLLWWLLLIANYWFSKDQYFEGKIHFSVHTQSSPYTVGEKIQVGP